MANEWNETFWKNSNIFSLSCVCVFVHLGKHIKCLPVKRSQTLSSNFTDMLSPGVLNCLRVWFIACSLTVDMKNINQLVCLIISLIHGSGWKIILNVLKCVSVIEMVFFISLSLFLLSLSFFNWLKGVPPGIRLLTRKIFQIILIISIFQREKNISITNYEVDLWRQNVMVFFFCFGENNLSELISHSHSK